MSKIKLNYSYFSKIYSSIKFLNLKKSLILFMIFVSAFSLNAAKDWTFMVYVDGDNNLEEAAIDDFKEMASIGSDANVKILVMMDRIPGYDTSYGDWTDTRRGVIMRGDEPDTTWGESMGEMDMGDPDTLKDFMLWGVKNYPSKKYAIILWNHGGGWRTQYIDLVKSLTTAETDEEKDSIGDEIDTLLRANSVTPELEEVVLRSTTTDSTLKSSDGTTGSTDGVEKAICWDDTNNSHLNMKDVQNALLDVYNAPTYTNPVMDLIGFDACVMGMVEVAYEMREEVTKSTVMVASEDNEPNDGWPYQTILADLVAQPEWLPSRLGQSIVERYDESYGTSVTMAAVNLAKITDLANAISTFAANMTLYWNDDSKKPTIRNLAASVKTAFDSAIIAEASDSTDAFGLTINFPSTGADDDYTAANIDFVQDTNWATFLDNYPLMTNSWIATARSASGFIGNFYDIYSFASNIVGEYDFTVDPTSLTVAEDGTGFIEVVLDVRPDSDVTIVASIYDNKPVASEINGEIVAPGEVTFTNTEDDTEPGYWENPQKISVKGLSDDFAGDDSCKAKFAIKAGSDPNFTHLSSKSVDVTVESDELAQIVVTPGALTISEAGGTGTFKVYLKGKPRGNITISVKSLDTAEATVSPSILNFSTDVYNLGNAQTVTVTGVADDFVGDDLVSIQMSVTASTSDPAYEDVDEFVAVTCTDTSGQSADFKVLPTLWKANTSYIVDSYVISDDGHWYKCTVAGTSGEVEPGWDTTFGNITDDNDVKWKRVAESSLELPLAESGGKNNFDVVLLGRPHVPVILNLVSADTAEATINKAKITFTKDNWDIPQTATVTGQNDDLVGDQEVDIDITVDVTSDTHFVSASAQSVTLNMIDDDTAGFTVTPVKMTMSENSESKTFSVVLTKGPAKDNVIINISPLAIGTVVGTDTVSGDVIVNKASVTFDSSNWKTPQQVTITSTPDHRLRNKLGMVKIEPSVAGTYAPWVSAGPPITPEAQYVNITLVNDDVAGYTLSKDSISVKEGTSTTYTIVLNAEPNGSVTINGQSNDINELSLTATLVPADDSDSVTFTSANWDTPQSIQINGIVDEYATDDSVIVIHTVNTDDAARDTAFDNMGIQNLKVTVTNDKTINSAEMIVSVNKLTIDEVGASNSKTFAVVLDAKPHSNVLIKVVSSDITEATSDKSELTFTSFDWDTAQNVTITSKDTNFLGDGTSNIDLSIKVASSDPTFAKAAKKMVVVTVTNNDATDAGGISSSESGLVLLQNRGKGTFTLALTGRPRTSVKLNLSVADSSTAKLSLSSVTFDKNNWTTPKTITVTGDPNNASIANSDTILTVVADASSDAAWVARATGNPTSVQITVTNSLTGGFTTAPTSLIIDEDGATKSFEVVLNQEPNSDVMIDLVAGGTGIASLSAAKLTFTTGNWHTPQTVDVLSNGTDYETDQSATVTCSFDPLSDPNFKDLPDKVVAVTIRNINPVAVDDTASAISFKAVIATADNDPVVIRVLNNDTDPRGLDLTVKSVTVPTGGSAVISDDSKTIVYTPPLVAADYTFDYVITNGAVAHGDSPAATVTVAVEKGQPVTIGSVVIVKNTDAPVLKFTNRPKAHITYYDPIKDPAGLKLKKYTLKSLTSASVKDPKDEVKFEWRKLIRLFSTRTFSQSYRAGTIFQDFTGQESSLLSQTFSIKYKSNDGTIKENNIGWELLLKPPVISALKRFTTPYDDFTNAADPLRPAWAAKLHPGSIVHVVGSYFGSRKPIVWLEYVNSRGIVKKARCRVLKYTPYYDAKERANKSYMNPDPSGLVDTRGSYGDSELKIMLPTRLNKDWDYTKGHTIVVDNKVGMSSYSGLIEVTPSSNSNSAPVAKEDIFDGVRAVSPNSKRNELDVLDNDEFPNCDEIKVKITIKPDKGGRVTWNASIGKLLYTPKKDFAALAEDTESFTYQVIEKYTDQKLSSSADVQVLVKP